MGERAYVESAFFHFIPQFVSEDDLFNKVYQTYRGWITQANHKTWKKSERRRRRKRRHVSAPRKVYQNSSSRQARHRRCFVCAVKSLLCVSVFQCVCALSFLISVCVFTCFEFVCVFSVLPDLIVFTVWRILAQIIVSWTMEINSYAWSDVKKLLVQYSADISQTVCFCVCVCKSFSCHFSLCTFQFL